MLEVAANITYVHINVEVVSYSGNAAILRKLVPAFALTLPCLVILN